jgi:hypothetical protein
MRLLAVRLQNLNSLSGAHEVRLDEGAQSGPHSPLCDSQHCRTEDCADHFQSILSCGLVRLPIWESGLKA